MKKQKKNISNRSLYSKLKSPRFVVLAIILIYLLSPLSGQVQFYSKWIKCGQKPVAKAGPGIGGAGAVYYREVATINPIRYIQEYYCSPLDAEKAGISADPNYYEFPELEKAGLRR